MKSKRNRTNKANGELNSNNKKIQPQKARECLRLKR